MLLGLVLGTGMFAAFYHLGTARCREMMREAQPELAWLKKEFNLTDAEYARITALHQAYLPQCAKRCSVIDELNTRLKASLAEAAPVTAEVENLLAERARVRAQCETEMLKHFQEVSRLMTPEQSRRYLSWVQEETVLRPQAMESRHKRDRSHDMTHEHQR